MPIRRIIADDTKRTRKAVLGHPDLEGNLFYYRNIPDLPSAEQSGMLRDTARRLGIEHYRRAPRPARPPADPLLSERPEGKLCWNLGDDAIRRRFEPTF